MLSFLVHKIVTFYIKGTLEFKNVQTAWQKIKGYKERNKTMSKITTAGRVIHDLPAVALYTVTNLVGGEGPSDFHLFGSPKKHLNCK
jgi:hypothetical protein